MILLSGTKPGERLVHYFHTVEAPKALHYCATKRERAQQGITMRDAMCVGADSVDTPEPQPPSSELDEGRQRGRGKGSNGSKANLYWLN